MVGTRVAAFGLLLAGCAEDYLRAAVPPEGADTAERRRYVAGICDSAVDMNEIHVDGRFPGTGQCPFGASDNLDMHDRYITARLRENESLSIPEGGVLCGLD